MVPAVGHKLLFEAAAETSLTRANQKRFVLTDFTSLPKALYTPFARRRIIGKKNTSNQALAATKKRRAKSPKVLAHLAVWSAEELQEIESARDGRHKTRFEKGVPHNRTCAEKGLRKLVFFAMSISNPARISKEKCEGEIDRSVVTGPRRSCRVATCAQWAEVAVAPLMILLNAQDRAAERSAQRAGAGLVCSRNGSALQHEFGFAFQH